MYIIVSRLKNNCDYDSLLSGIVEDNNIKTYDCDDKSIDYKYNSDNKIIVIKGKVLLKCVPGLTDLCNNQSAPEVNEKKLAEKLLNIINDIVKKVGIISESQKDYLLIHWGGPDREKYSTRLRNAVKQIDDFPFEIIDFSSKDNIYENLKKGNAI